MHLHEARTFEHSRSAQGFTTRLCGWKRTIAVSIVLAMIVTVAMTWLSRHVASAATATFDPVTATAMGAQSVFGRVVTDGRGTFHAVVRENGLPQQIVHRRSVDGGRNWTIAGRFKGDNGGATRPWVATDGDRVAIAFIGSWCDPRLQGFCEEAPYLVTSADAGRTWGLPVRMDRQAFDVRVAVNDDRTWIAWDKAGPMQLRGTADGGRTFFTQRSVVGRTPHLTAADGAMVLAFYGYTAQGHVVPRAVSAAGRVVGAAYDLPGQDMEFAGGPSVTVASADGRVHVLLAERSSGMYAWYLTEPATGRSSVWVTTATGSGAFAAPVKVMPAGYSAAINAARGTVGVAVADRAGTTWVATSSDHGASFSGPLAVSSTPGREPLVELGIATPGPERPIARFGWSVPERYADTDGNGLANPANGSGDDAVDQLRVYANQALSVTLDGCGSLAGSGRAIAQYTWIVDGIVRDAGPAKCRTTITVDDGTTATVRLMVKDDQGDTASVQHDVTPRDYVIVSLGDSVASGEGNAHAGWTNAAAWQDGPCHRSAHAGPALAARRIEQADPHSSVTFIQLACSGAAIVDSPEVAGTDAPDTGGLLDAYRGVEKPGLLRPSQLAQMKALVGNRPVDALLVSIGANDVRFSEVIIGCLMAWSCNASTARTDFETRLTTLRDRYARLARAIDALGIAAGRVHLTEYFDPTSDDNGVTNMRCAVARNAQTILSEFKSLTLISDILAAAEAGGLLDDDEAIWARDGVIKALNDAGRSAALTHGWRYVGGIAAQFSRHGYCADDHWVVRLEESLTLQHDEKGAFHPNRAGQQVYGSALFADLQATLVIPAALTSPGATGGPAALGDLMVVTVTRTTITSAVVNATGAVPLPGAVRRLDRLALGDGQILTAGPPAIDGVSAVGMWTELSVSGAAYDSQTLATQLAVRPNAAVRSVRIVQAPADAHLIVAARESLVQATIDAMIAAPESLAVTTTVIAHDSSGTARDLVPATTERVKVDPGRNTVLLPRASKFTAQAGDTVYATVEVTDPIGTAPGDGYDNVAKTLRDQAPTAVATRPLRVMVGRAGLGPATVSCQNTKGVAEHMASYASAALPVAAPGVIADLFCGLQLPVQQNEPGLLEALAILDELARHTGTDAIVLVVPDGWLKTAGLGLIGTAIPGMRGVIVESTAPAETLSHELAHVFGVGHTPQPIPAFGARVDWRLNRAGVDWMVAVTQPKAWTGGATWDRLVALIGAPANTPRAIDPNGPGVWIRGTVSRQPDGSWALTKGQWLPAGPGAPTDPVDPGALHLARMSVEQLDANGNTIGTPQPIGLGAGGGLYSPGSTPPATPLGYGFSTRVGVDPGTSTLRLVLDNAVVDTVSLSAPPTVSLIGPAAGSRVPRGEPLTVSWTAADPDGDTLTASVFISDDDGVSWRPLASGVAGTTVTAPVPQDVGGNTVRVRVVVSDGVRFAEAVSGVFSAEPAATLGEERIVFVRGYDYFSMNPRLRLNTMRPDGTDVRELALPTASVYPTRPDGSTYCTTGMSNACTVTYTDPAWASDGRIYFVSNLRMPQFDGNDATPYDEPQHVPGPRIWSSKPDGSDLQPVTSSSSATAYWPTNPSSGFSLAPASLDCPAVSPDGNALVWTGRGGGSADSPNRIWIARREGGGWSPPVILVESGAPPVLTLHPSFPPAAAPPRLWVLDDPLDPERLNRVGCPRWSPDSTSLVFVSELEYTYDKAGTSTRAFDYSAVVQAATDGSSMRVISPKPAYVQGTGALSNFQGQIDFNQSVDWAPSSTIVVSRGTSNPDGVASSPAVFGAFTLNPADGTLTRITPEPDIDWLTRPSQLKVAPNGTLYSWLPRAAPPPCYNTGYDLGLVDPASGATQRITPDANTPCHPFDRSFDWGVQASVGGTGTGLPLIVADVASAPSDPNVPVDANVTAVTPPSDLPAPGADDQPAAPLPAAASLTGIRVLADSPTIITLRTVDGTLTPFEIVQPPPASEMTVEGRVHRGITVTTGPDGRVLVTPVTGFRGTTTFTYSVLGDSAHSASVTIAVVGNAPPVAINVRITVPAGVETVVDPSVLLANDVDPDATSSPTLPGTQCGLDAATSLRIASVYGSSNGRAWLDVSDMVHLLPAEAGTYVFAYIIVDAEGATAAGSALVTATVPAADPTPEAPAPTNEPFAAPVSPDPRRLP